MDVDIVTNEVWGQHELASLVHVHMHEELEVLRMLHDDRLPRPHVNHARWIALEPVRTQHESGDIQFNYIKYRA